MLMYVAFGEFRFKNRKTLIEILSDDLSINAQYGRDIFLAFKYDIKTINS